MFGLLRPRATASLSFITIRNRAALKHTYNLRRRFWQMTKRRLGRGLSALISTDPLPADHDEVRELEIDLIQPNRQQPRTSFDQPKPEEMAQSLRPPGT